MEIFCFQKDTIAWKYASETVCYNNILSSLNFSVTLLFGHIPALTLNAKIYVIALHWKKKNKNKKTTKYESNLNNNNNNKNKSELTWQVTRVAKEFLYYWRDFRIPTHEFTKYVI